MSLVQLVKSRKSSFRRSVRDAKGEIVRTYTWEPGDVLDVPRPDLRVLADDFGKTLFPVKPDKERPGKYLMLEVDYDEFRARVAAGDFDEDTEDDESPEDAEPGEPQDEESGQASDSGLEDTPEAGTNPAIAEGGSDGKNATGRPARRRR